MCGLVGVLSANVFAKHKDAFKQLLYLDTLRGEDSTGVAVITNTRKVKGHKSIAPGYEFIRDPRFNNLLSLTDTVWIGHNRYGTVGERSKLNAHPFEVINDKGFIDLIGAHNGTIKNKYKITNHVDFGTDSEALLNMIAKEGLKETLQEVEGAWALTYFDFTQDKLCFVRNKERPLFFCVEEGQQTLLWASEAWMLRTVCGRTGIKILNNEIMEIEEDTLYMWDRPEKTTDTLKLSKEGGMEGKPEVFFTRSDWYGANDYWKNKAEQEAREAAAKASQKDSKSTTLVVVDGSKQQPEKSTSGETSSRSQTKNGLQRARELKQSVNGKKLYTGFEGQLLTREELEWVLTAGCAWCEDEMIEVKDAFGWMNEDKVVCKHCLDGDKNVLLPEVVSTVEASRKVN